MQTAVGPEICRAVGAAGWMREGDGFSGSDGDPIIRGHCGPVLGGIGGVEQASKVGRCAAHAGILPLIGSRVTVSAITAAAACAGSVAVELAQVGSPE